MGYMCFKVVKDWFFQTQGEYVQKQHCMLSGCRPLVVEMVLPCGYTLRLAKLAQFGTNSPAGCAAFSVSVLIQSRSVQLYSK